jgi:uncharacterized membrane protein YfcA
VSGLPFLLALFAVAVVAGATASVAGFGIGSLLTPLVAAHHGTPVAVAAVALPHAIATALRAWRLRDAIDRDVLKGFGLVSAAGALAGALVYSRIGAGTLTVVLALLLLATSVAALTGWTSRWRARGAGVWLLGLASGLFGGVAGNQGGMRAAALLAFSLTPRAFVATSTATGLLVDAARVPVYVWRAGGTIASLWLEIAVASGGVLAGTLLGERVLLGMSAERFRRVLGALIGLLGLWLLWGLQR